MKKIFLLLLLFSGTVSYTSSQQMSRDNVGCCLNCSRCIVGNTCLCLAVTLECCVFNCIQPCAAQSVLCCVRCLDPQAYARYLKRQNEILTHAAKH